ncbi:MAG TPA: carboxymuconolactone decarboxylase family protein [Candidatus Dormibacteraeota bacterium]
MARVPYVKSDPVFARVEAMGRPVLNLYRALANQPAALEAFLGMSAYVRGGSSLDPKLREAVILTAARELGSEYEVAHHSKGVNFDDLDERGRCAVDYARSAARTRNCDDETFARLEDHFTTPEIVDLVVTVGWYHLCAVILGTLEVELEAG